MNDVDFPVARVLEGIDAAAAAGLSPVKINMVVKRGINEQRDPADGAAFQGSGHVLRFIEYMDVGHTNGWRMDDVVPSAEVIGIDRTRAAAGADRCQLCGRSRRSAGATRDGSGEIGVISSVTQAFCSDCTRARLATDGKLYTCLFATAGDDLRALCAAARPTTRSATIVAAIWSQRADRYSEIRSENTRALPKIEMSYIGG